MVESYDYKAYKVVAVLASNLEAGIAVNVVGHLAVAIGSNIDKKFMGQSPIVDKSGVKHLGILKYPFITTKVKPGKIRRVIEEARAKKSILIADYPKEMLTTGHDDELVAAIGVSEEERLEYMGVILFGEADDVNAITGKFQLWD